LSLRLLIVALGGTAPRQVYELEDVWPFIIPEQKLIPPSPPGLPKTITVLFSLMPNGYVWPIGA